MSRGIVGWVWVAGQAVLLCALAFLPAADAWTTPPWILAVASTLFLGGLGVVAIGALGLGSSLTPSPVPTQRGTLTTTGLYRFVRHPIYTGVISLAAGMTLRSRSWTHVAVALVTLVFFDRKAAWEERQLAERYDDYSTYAAVTPKFMPRPWTSPSH